MKNLSLLALIVLTFSACHNIKETGKAAANGAGQAVGQGTSEFISGVKNGVDKSFQSTLILSDSLKAQGLSAGKFAINHESGDSVYRLNIYLVFSKNIDRNITVKVFDQKGLEYGRSNVNIKGKANDAHYVDVVFDKRTEIESKSKFTVE
jgi:hypothetical protein